MPLQLDCACPFTPNVALIVTLIAQQSQFSPFSQAAFINENC